MFETDRTDYSAIYHKTIKGIEFYTKAAVFVCHMFTSLLPLLYMQAEQTCFM